MRGRLPESNSRRIQLTRIAKEAGPVLLPQDRARSVIRKGFQIMLKTKKWSEMTV
jgi:hypothetical protein